MMASSWYVEKRGRQLGPFTGPQLKELAATGRLEPGDLVRRADSSKTVPAGEVRGLFPEPDPGAVSGGPPPPPSAEADGPPPLPTDGGRLDGIGEKIKSLTQASRAAARLAAAQARKAQLVNLTLPAAFLALGRDIHADGCFRNEFPELYAEVAELERRIERLTAPRPQSSLPRGLANRAKDAATAAQDAVQAKALSLKMESLLRRLGESSFSRHGERSGPEALVRPIIDGQSRTDSLDQQILRLSEDDRGRYVTPRRIIRGAVGLVSLGAVFAILATTNSEVGGRSGERSPDPAVGGRATVADRPAEGGLPHAAEGRDGLEPVGQSGPEAVDAGLAGRRSIDAFLGEMRDTVESDPRCGGRFPLVMQFDERVFFDRFGQPDSDLSIPGRMRLWGYRCEDGAVSLRVSRHGGSIIFVREVSYTGRANARTRAITRRQFKETLQSIVDRIGPQAWLAPTRFLDTFGPAYSERRAVPDDPNKQYFVFQCSDGIVVLNLQLFFRNVTFHRVEIERIMLNDIEEP